MKSIHRQPIELKVELEDLFALSRGEIFEDGMESEFSRKLVALIEQHQDRAVDALSDLIASEGVDSEVASEALRWVGHIEDPTTHQARLALLERMLFASSAKIRDGAVLGLASMDDPDSIRSLQEAINRETVGQLRQNMRQVVEQLIETQQEQSSLATLLASEEVLRRDWDTPEEDGAWAHL